MNGGNGITRGSEASVLAERLQVETGSGRSARENRTQS